MQQFIHASVQERRSLMLRSLKETNFHGTPMFPLQIYSHKDKNGFYSVTAHWHEELEFLYIEEGTMHGIISGTPYEMKAGEFYFINSGELHELSTHNHSLHHAIVFDPKLLNFDLYDSCQHNFIQPITQKKLLFPNNISSVLSQKERESLRQLFLAVIYNYHHPEQCALLKIKICLLQILELCFRTEILIQNKTTGKQLSSMNQLKEVLDFIRSHYAEEITLKELADIACMSPTYFCRYFHQEMGKTPFAFLNEYRVKKAAILLDDSSLYVSDIAINCGFDNISYFIRKFKEYQGITPKKYRSRKMPE